MEQSIRFIHYNKRFVIGIAIAAIVISVFMFGASSKVRNASASKHNVKYFKCISIDHDDTLWSIAEEYSSEEYSDYNDYIDEVKSINGLTTDKIYCGATLLIPYYAAP